ncbi:hypothetical protein HHK36_025179 [Tetracentron sinense]|uniref:Bifunctional inhibitor/plant lipid transfer protein/seed storage helical domain-containing protein n=1 Tax=Tetracentron sinense TaxID=13715 RepID=A0A834YRD9_TETSI|nr:hypothetical protein HHK36_025179 [Tetracentron sinense]
MRTESILLCFLLISSLSDSIFPAAAAAAAAPTVEQQCSNEFTKVGTCLDYATGKAGSPTSECCTAVTEIRNHDPVCLCYLIQQTHNGDSTLKGLGLQEARLLKLSSSCKLANASISECPKLLNLSPSSPDYAIFTNSSSAENSTTTAASTMPSHTKADGSNAFMHGPRFGGPTAMAIATAIFMSGFPTGFMSMFHIGA